MFSCVNKHILYIHSEIANIHKLHNNFFLINLCFHRDEEYLSQYIDRAIFDSRRRQDTVPAMKMSGQVHSEIANIHKLHNNFFLINLCFHRDEEYLSQYIDRAIFDSQRRQDTVPAMKMSGQVLGPTQPLIQQIPEVKQPTCEDDHSPLRNLCIFIVMSMYPYCMFMYLHRANWHSSANLTEVFPLSYHIISYHIISYHIVSYHIISYHIISYHIISYHIISYII